MEQISTKSITASAKVLDYLIEISFQEVNRLVSLFENEDDRTVHTKYYLLTVEIKDSNVMIDGRIFFNQPVKII